MKVITTPWIRENASHDEIQAAAASLSVDGQLSLGTRTPNGPFIAKF